MRTTIKAFLLGMSEFRLTVNTHCEGAEESGDWGREWAHRLTLRVFEPG